jgi:hypothetical protein
MVKTTTRGGRPRPTDTASRQSFRNSRRQTIRDKNEAKCERIEKENKFTLLDACQSIHIYVCCSKTIILQLTKSENLIFFCFYVYLWIAVRKSPTPMSNAILLYLFYYLLC